MFFNKNKAFLLKWKMWKILVVLKVFGFCQWKPQVINLLIELFFLVRNTSGTSGRHKEMNKTRRKYFDFCSLSGPFEHDTVFKCVAQHWWIQTTVFFFSWGCSIEHPVRLTESMWGNYQISNSYDSFPKLAAVPDKTKSKLQIQDVTFKTQREKHEVNVREGNSSLCYFTGTTRVSLQEKLHAPTVLHPCTLVTMKRSSRFTTPSLIFCCTAFPISFSFW